MTRIADWPEPPLASDVAPQLAAFLADRQRTRDDLHNMTLAFNAVAKRMAEDAGMYACLADSIAKRRATLKGRDRGDVA